MHPRITEARVLSGYILELSFTDGSRGTVDLEQWIGPSRGVFAALQDPAFFALVSVDRDAGTIVWPNGADLDPDVLYEASHVVGAPAGDSHTLQT